MCGVSPYAPVGLNDDCCIAAIARIDRARGRCGEAGYLTPGHADAWQSSGEFGPQSSRPAVRPRLLQRHGTGRRHRPRPARTARFTAGVSPAALAQAYLDWATHLACAPGKRARLVDKAIRKAMRFGNYVRRYALSGGKIETVSILCRRTIVSRTQRGRNSRSTSSIKAFCCNSNGGTTPRLDCVASPRATRTWSNSPHGRCSTCSRRRISR